MSQSDRILPGVAMMIGFCTLAPLIDVFSKLAAQEVPVGVIVLGRGLVQAVLMAPVMVVMGFSLRMDRRTIGLTALRALMLASSTYCFVAAVRVMPIADALAIAFVEPFLILVIGRFAFGEQVGQRRIVACVVGFLGALLVIQPSFAAFGATAFFPLGTALSFALYMLVTRHLSRRMHPVAMQFHTALLAALICLPVLGFGTWAGIGPITFEMPRGVFLLWCVGVGVAATVSHMAITYALSFAPSSTLAPLHYLEIVTATLFGYLIFDDFPDGLTWLGIGIIVSSGLYIIHRERRLAKAARLADLATVSASEAPL